MYAVVTVAVDLYAENHVITSTMLGARMVEYADTAQDPLYAVLERLPGDWRQLTPAEVEYFVMRERERATAEWHQLSLF